MKCFGGRMKLFILLLDINDISGRFGHGRIKKTNTLFFQSIFRAHPQSWGPIGFGVCVRLSVHMSSLS